MGGDYLVQGRGVLVVRSLGILGGGRDPMEKAFGMKMETLLNMQAWYDAHAMRQRAGEIAVKPYRFSAPDPGR